MIIRSSFLVRLGLRQSRVLVESRQIKRCLSTEDHILKSEFPDVHIPQDVSLPSLVWDQNAEKHSDRIAMVDAVTEKTYTFHEASQECKKVGLMLQSEFGIGRGDVVGFFLPSSPEYLTCLTGVIGIGAAATTINPAYTTQELTHQLGLSHPKLMLTTNSAIPTVKSALAQADNDCKIVIVGEGPEEKHQNDPKITSLDSLLFQFRCTIDTSHKYVIDPEGIAMLPHSSGTTGLPKAVMLTNNNLIANISQSAHAEGLDYLLPITEEFQEKTVLIMPLFHAFGSLVTSLPTLRMGGCLAILPKFESESFVNALQHHRPTFLHIAPPVVSFLANRPQVTPDHLKSIREVLVAAAPFGEALAKKYLEKAPHAIFKEAWGMTETGPLGLVTPTTRPKIGSCGVLLPNTEAKIVDPSSGSSLPANQRGELCLKGPQIMKGYLGNEAATQETIRDGWMHSGDIAYYDEDGRFYIVDRLKELIKVKGFQVAPAELEDLLRKHPKVLDVGVIGVEDERKGEAPFAFVVKKDPELTNKEVFDFVAENTTDYKHLTGGIRFVDAIPKNPSGKILRRELRKMV